MKNAYRAFRQYSCQFRKNWLEYLILFGGLDILNHFKPVSGNSIFSLDNYLCPAGRRNSVYFISKYCNYSDPSSISCSEPFN